MRQMWAIGIGRGWVEIRYGKVTPRVSLSRLRFPTKHVKVAWGDYQYDLPEDTFEVVDIIGGKLFTTVRVDRFRRATGVRIKKGQVVPLGLEKA